MNKHIPADIYIIFQANFFLFFIWKNTHQNLVYKMSWKLLLLNLSKRKNQKVTSFKVIINRHIWIHVHSKNYIIWFHMFLRPFFWGLIHLTWSPRAIYICILSSCSFSFDIKPGRVAYRSSMQYAMGQHRAHCLYNMQ